MREIELDRELTCQTCDETHSDFHKEVYNHNSQLMPLIVCRNCGCGEDAWKY